MKGKAISIAVAASAILAAGLSIPLYLVAFIGVGMSPSSPHLGFGWACLLWTAPVACLALSVALLRVQGLARLWRWLLTVPLMLLSAAELVWTLLILLEG